MAEGGRDPEDINGDGIKDVWIDTDGDGVPDAIDFDANGFPDGDLLDLNNDGVPDAIRVAGLTDLMYLTFTRPANSPTTFATSTTDRSTTTAAPTNQETGPPGSAVTSESASTSELAVASTGTTGPTSITDIPGSSVTSSAAGTSETAISSSSNSNVPVGAIVGGVIGGLVVILLIALVIWRIMRERRLLAESEQARNVNIVGGNEGHETTKG